MPALLRSIVAHATSEDTTEADIVAAVVLALLLVALVLLFGKLLWNNVVAGPGGLIPGARPARSVWKILGLYLLVRLFVG